jgi:type I site-specific restriction endonuclease
VVLCFLSLVRLQVVSRKWKRLGKTPEEKAREAIDVLLGSAGWNIQDRMELNLGAGWGVAVREFPLQVGFADYMLFVDRYAVGVIEAKPEGTTLSGVSEQTKISSGATTLKTDTNASQQNASSHLHTPS